MVICTAAIRGSTATPASAGGAAVAPAIAAASTPTTRQRLTRPAPFSRQTEIPYSTCPARSLARGALAGRDRSEPEAVDPGVEGAEPIAEPAVLDRDSAEHLPAGAERRRWRILAP